MLCMGSVERVALINRSALLPLRVILFVGTHKQTHTRVIKHTFKLFDTVAILRFYAMSEG